MPTSELRRGRYAVGSRPTTSTTTADVAMSEHGERRAPAEEERQAARERRGRTRERVGVAVVDCRRRRRREHASPISARRDACRGTRRCTHGFELRTRPTKRVSRTDVGSAFHLVTVPTRSPARHRPPGMTVAYISRCTRARSQSPTADHSQGEPQRPRGRRSRRRDRRIVSGPTRQTGSPTKEPPDDHSRSPGTAVTTPRHLDAASPPAPSTRQGVRQGRGRGPCARRRDRRLRDRSLHRDHGPVGLRQVDAHAHARRPRHAHARLGLDRRHRPQLAQRQEAHAAPP